MALKTFQQRKMESLSGEGTQGDENQQVNEELLLKQIADLVINQRLLSGKANAEDRVVNFVHPEELKVTLEICFQKILLGSPFLLLTFLCVYF